MATVRGFCNFVVHRNFSLTTACNGKRNFRKFLLHNRGTKLFKEKQKTDPHPDVPVYTYGVREVGYKDHNGKFVEVPEMIPELIVPDLSNFKLKPYVSYRVNDIDQPEFDAKYLFDVVYKKKIVEDFKKGKLDEHGQPLEPSAEESLTPEIAKLKARQTGSDIFHCRTKREIEENPLGY